MTDLKAPSLCPTFRYPALLRFFEEISAIPRETYHEQAIADYLCEFAEARGLSYRRDTYQNVFISKPATAGLEDKPPLLLQGHTDMVCEKKGGVVHDFATDPLRLYVEDGWLRAEGTTLGADDGVAVATMLYLLDGGADAHPALECLFTASEEMGMDGAEGFDYSQVRARRMLNLDSPDEQLIIAGCAGGLHSYLTLPCTPVPLVGQSYRIRVSGLAGGHSGEDIHRGRANAILLLTRVLRMLWQESSLALVTIEGGRRENVIPREAEAVVCLRDEACLTKLDAIHASLLDGLCDDDGDFSLTATPCYVSDTMLSSADTDRVLSLIEAIPCGVLAKNPLGTVEYSRNLGVLSTSDENGERRLSFILLSRSSRDAQLTENAETLDAIAARFGLSFVHKGRYPGWDFAEHSPLRDAYVAAHRAVWGKSPEVTTIHAGLECGIIAGKLPDMDMISVGPRVLDLHSPDERLHLLSFEKFMDTVLHLLQSN